jgi:hypothetical protein
MARLIFPPREARLRFPVKRTGPLQNRKRRLKVTSDNLAACASLVIKTYEIGYLAEKHASAQSTPSS